MIKRCLIILVVLLTVSVLWSLPVLSQGMPGPSDVETISMLVGMISWKGIASSIFLIVGAWLFLWILRTVVHHLGEIFVRRRLLLHKLSTFIRFGVYLVTIVSIVHLSFNISREALALLGGGAAVVLGFAVKDLMASVVAGVMLMFDRPFQVGDRVSFGGQYGDISAIGMRSVKLQTLDDSTVTIPNNMFLTNITSSGNYGVLDMQVVVDFHIGIDQDAQRARELVREATALSRYIYLPKPIFVGVSEVMMTNYVAIRLRLKAYVLDTRYEKEFETDVTLRVLEAFHENGIHPPAILYRSVSEIGRTKPPMLSLADQES